MNLLCPALAANFTGVVQPSQTPASSTSDVRVPFPRPQGLSDAEAGEAGATLFQSYAAAWHSLVSVGSVKRPLPGESASVWTPSPRPPLERPFWVEGSVESSRLPLPPSVPPGC